MGGHGLCKSGLSEDGVGQVLWLWSLISAHEFRFGFVYWACGGLSVAPSLPGSLPSRTPSLSDPELGAAPGTLAQATHAVLGAVAPQFAPAHPATCAVNSCVTPSSLSSPLPFSPPLAVFGADRGSQEHV